MLGNFSGDWNAKAVLLMNKSIRCDKFKMLTVTRFRLMLPQNAWTCSLDLQDAYWHVPIAPHFRPFLGFRLGMVKYCFKVLPFRLNIASRVFTKLVTIIVTSLRRQGINVAVYLDDWLVWGASKELCASAVLRTCQELKRRGFVLNIKKSRLKPQQNFQWLGIQWDTTFPQLSLPLSRQESTRAVLRSFLNQLQVSRRDFEKILGLLQFCSIVDPWLKVVLKDAGRFWKTSASKAKRDRKRLIPKQLQSLLSPWLKPHALSMSVPLVPPPVSLTIHSDASQWGWGAHTDSKTASGKWSFMMTRCHINFLELLAAFLSLRKFNPPRHSHIRLVMDNITAVGCLKRGGSRSPILNGLMKLFVKLQIKKKWFLSTSHLSGIRNVVADSLSRQKPVSTEWTLDKTSFLTISQLQPPPEVDLFATRLNHQLPLYVSPFTDPKAVAVDAFRLDWNIWNTVYLFPPLPPPRC